MDETLKDFIYQIRRSKSIFRNYPIVNEDENDQQKELLELARSQPYDGVTIYNKEVKTYSIEYFMGYSMKAFKKLGRGFWSIGHTVISHYKSVENPDAPKEEKSSPTYPEVFVDNKLNPGEEIFKDAVWEEKRSRNKRDDILN